MTIETTDKSIFHQYKGKIKTNTALRPITITTIQLITPKPIRHQAKHLRGFFGTKFPEFKMLHNHRVDGSHILGYPKVQYKILGNKAFIIGIDIGAELILSLTENLKSMTLGLTQYPIVDREIDTKVDMVGAVRKPLYYQFITPWLALNPLNYRKFQTLTTWKERKELLNRTLIGNCLALAKGLEIMVPFRLYAHTHLDMVDIPFKETLIKGFVGRFKINFKIIELLGIGKGVSRGYGTVLRTPRQEKEDS